ncbi:MAG: cyclic nucleotide-binding domain-containing protein [Hyphomicrobiaceae bacterium]|nr:cyclic nucleotide-binding domain-containing protein [Hyphomicrobiaceae bacterium]
MIETQNIQEMLNEIPLFSGCSPDVLSRMAKIVVERDCAKGEEIYHAGDEALDMFVLVNGLVSFTAGSGVSHLYVEKLMKRHMIFGWAALVPEHPRRLGSAKCLERSQLLVLNGDRVMEILGSDPQSGFVVMKRLCSMIASTFIDRR